MRRAHSGFRERACDAGRDLARRTFFKQSLLGLGAAFVPGLIGGCGDSERSGRAVRSNIGNIGELGPPVDGVRVPPGFSVRVLARAGEAPASASSYIWHGNPDGGATYSTEDGGWIYTSNAELGLELGGAGALRFDAEGDLIDAYPILTGTNVNCAGGKTPWDTWLSCEETATGMVHECDPYGKEAAIRRPALGVFQHEAAAVDPIRHHIYLTEDQRDGRFYRFVPEGLTPGGYADLSKGILQVALWQEDGSVQWLDVPDPSAASTPTRAQVPSSTVFVGGEGIWYHEGTVYFTTKGDNRVWAYDAAKSRLSIFYDAATNTNPILTGVDNVTVSPAGDVLVAEDGGDMQIVAILPDGSLKVLVQVLDQPGSEICGPALSPDGTRLYFSSQRAKTNSVFGGITYEITGTFFT